MLPTPARTELTVTPGAATKPPPPPRSFFTVTVKVCGEPTKLVPLVSMLIWASTQVFVAGSLFTRPLGVVLPLVDRMTEAVSDDESSLNTTVAVAPIDADPVAVELTVTLQVKVVTVPVSSQSSAVMNTVSPVGEMETESTLTPADEAVVTVIVKSWGSPTSFTSSSSMATEASTQNFSASSLLSPVSSVHSSGSVTPRTVTVVQASTTVWPTSVAVRSTSHSPVVLTVRQLSSKPVVAPSPPESAPGPERILSSQSVPAAAGRKPAVELTTSMKQVSG